LSTRDEGGGDFQLCPRELATPHCDGETWRDALGASVGWLEQHIDSINSLNVYPVPDGDTGTNMFLTMQAALRETATLSELTISNVSQAIAHGALMGARGNSGVILSQVFRGMAKVLDDQGVLGGTDLAEALIEGAKTAYKGVIQPVEGTILTVAREAATAAKAAAAAQDSVLYVLECAVEEARDSVARTPSLLPVLRDAGVVDAGGQGLLVVLEGILRFLRGDQMATVSLPESLATPTVSVSQEYGFDTQLILTGQDLPLEQVRTTIMSMGDSVLVVGDDSAIKVHVHTGRPGAVIDYAISVGTVSDIVIENMQEQSEEFAAAHGKESDIGPVPTESMADVAIVAVTSGAGLEQVFRSLGASAVVLGGQTNNPSTEELLNALEGLAPDNVILLPNNGNVILAAQQAQQLATKNVRVIPTKTSPQGISALLAFNYQADLETNVANMQEAAGQIQTAEITMAVRSAQVNGLHVQDGQVIGLLNGELTAAGKDLKEVVGKLLRQMRAADYDIITIYYGESITAEEAQAMAAYIQEACPEPEVELVEGAQPHYQYVISAE